MSGFNAGGIEYTVEVGTASLIEARKDVDKFERDSVASFNKAEGGTKKLGGGITKLASSISTTLVAGALASMVAAVGVATAALGKMALESARANRETENMARLAKLSTTEFKALAYATSQYGINAEQIADISKDISDKIGEFARDATGQFQNFANTMGMTRDEAVKTAREFESMSGRDVLLAMVAGMEKAGASGAVMTQVLEAMGNDAIRLLPLLINNGKLLREMEKAMLGVISSSALTDEQSKALGELGAAYDRLGGALTSIKNLVSAELAPTFTEWLNSVTKYSNEATHAVMYMLNSIGKGSENNIYTVNDQIESLRASIKSVKADIESASKGELSLSMISDEDIKKFEDSSFFGGVYDALFGEKEAKIKVNFDVKKAEFESTLSELEAKLADLEGKRQGLLDKIVQPGSDPVKKPENKKPVAPAGGAVNAGIGLTPDQKAAAKERLDETQKFFEQYTETVTSSMLYIQQFENTFGGEQLAAEKMRHEQSLIQLQEKYEKEKALAEKAGQDTSALTASYMEALMTAEAEHSSNWDAIVTQSAEARAKMVEDSLKYFEQERSDAKKHIETMAELASTRGEEEVIKERERYELKKEEMLARFEEERELLEENFISTAELEESYRLAKEEAEAEHQARMTKLVKEAEEERRSAQFKSMGMILTASSSFFGEMAGLFEKGKDEQSKSQRAMFALSKGFAIAMGVLNMNEAISKAQRDGLTWQERAAAMITAAATGVKILSSIKSTSYSGRRYGGPVSAGSTYEVNEAGVPEIVSAGGKDFLTMGTAGGKVTPLDKAGMMGGGVTINNYGPADSVEVRQTDRGVIIDIARREAERAAKAAYDRVADDFANNKGRVYNSAIQNTNLSGRAGSGRG